MLSGSRILLRARLETDVPILHAGLYEDLATRLLSSGRAWWPVPVERSPFRSDPDDENELFAVFTIAELESNAPVGDTALWAIDTHNRFAHLGMTLLAEHRGRGYAGEALQLLCRYAFEIRGLHRLQLETLADNAAMVGTARAAGFTQEGVLRGSAWVSGRFHDEVIFGLLADDWHPG